MSRCSKGHRIPKKLPYGATKGKYWCHSCDHDLVSEWDIKPIRKKERQRAKREILEALKVDKKI